MMEQERVKPKARSNSFKNQIGSIIKSVQTGRSRSGSYDSPPKQWNISLSDRLLLSGVLSKYTNVMKGFQHRWFTLDPDSGILQYFEKEEHKTQRPRGSVHLAGAVISPSDEDPLTFTVNAASGEIYRLRALDGRERQCWVNRLQATSQLHTDAATQNALLLAREHQAQTVKGASSWQPDKNCYKSSTVSVGSHANTKVPSQRPDPLWQVEQSLKQAQEEAGQLCCTIQDLPVSGEHITSIDRDLLLLKATTGAAVTCIRECYQLLQRQQVTVGASHHGNLLATRDESYGNNIVATGRHVGNQMAMAWVSHGSHLKSRTRPYGNHLATSGKPYDNLVTMADSSQNSHLATSLKHGNKTGANYKQGSNTFPGVKKPRTHTVSCSDRFLFGTGTECSWSSGESDTESESSEELLRNKFEKVKRPKNGYTVPQQSNNFSKSLGHSLDKTGHCEIRFHPQTRLTGRPLTNIHQWYCDLHPKVNTI